MLNRLLVTLLVASAAGVPRQRGGPLQHTLYAPSGESSQYNPNFAGRQNQDVHIVPIALPENQHLPAAHQPQNTGATFHVDPNTFKIQPGGQYNSPNQVLPQGVPSPPPPAYSHLPLHNRPSPGNPISYQNPFIERNPVVPLPTDNIINPGLPGGIQPPNVIHNPPSAVNPPGTPPPPPSQHISPSSEIVKRLIGNPPGGALLVGSNPPIFPIEKRLISNYTKLRPFVQDTFRCGNSQPNYVGYGYYADVDNDCQIFHVCLPWKELYPKTFASDVTYQFSFICPNQTVFSQDVLTCTWRSEAFPCAESPQLYWLNDNFFRKVNRDDGFGMKERYAHLNDKLDPPLKYDYDDFNPPKPIG